MPVVQIPQRFSQRYDTAANWAAKNPVLWQGEIGFESDTDLGKTGDGVTAWNSLLYTVIGRVNVAGLAAGKVLVRNAANDGWEAGDGGGGGGGGGIHIDDWVDTYADLPTPPPSGKVTYGNLGDGLVYGWNGSAWPPLGAGISITPGAADPYHNLVRLLMPCDGVNGQAIFYDPRGVPINDNSQGTISGGVTVLSGLIGYASASYMPLDLGSRDFCIEVISAPDPTCKTGYLLSNAQSFASNSWILEPTHASAPGKWQFFAYNASTATPNILVSTSNSLTGVMHHLAVSRSGSTMRMFYNGLIEATATVPTTVNVGNTFSQSVPLWIGSNNITDQFKGKLGGIRITVGHPRYSFAFTPPTSFV